MLLHGVRHLLISLVWLMHTSLWRMVLQELMLRLWIPIVLHLADVTSSISQKTDILEEPLAQERFQDFRIPVFLYLSSTWRWMITIQTVMEISPGSLSSLQGKFTWKTMRSVQNMFSIMMKKLKMEVLHLEKVLLVSWAPWTGMVFPCSIRDFIRISFAVSGDSTVWSLQMV